MKYIEEQHERKHNSNGTMAQGHLSSNTIEILSHDLIFSQRIIGVLQRIFSRDGFF